MSAAASWECLAGRAKAGDQGAVNGLLRGLEPYLHRLAQAVRGRRPDEDDLCQVALLAVWRGLDKYDPARPFAAWARVVAKRAMLSALRRAYRSVSFEDGYGFGVADRPPHESETDILPDWWVWDVMGGLDSKERQEVASRYGLFGVPTTQDTLARIQGRSRQRLSASVQDSLAAMRVAFEVQYGGQPA